MNSSAAEGGFFIAMTFFAPGSILFFYLFYKSGYIPRALAALGVFASVVMLLGNFIALTVPEYLGQVQYAGRRLA